MFRIGLIRVSGEALLSTVGGLSEERVGEGERVSGFSGERRKLWGRRGGVRVCENSVYLQ